MEENIKLKPILDENNKVINIFVFQESLHEPQILQENIDLKKQLLPYAKGLYPGLSDSDLQQKIQEYINSLPEVLYYDDGDMSLVWGMEDSIVVNRPEIGYFYDESRKAFIPPKPNDTYILNEETFTWEPDPNIKYDLHDDDNLYKYNKELLGWTPVEKNETET
jgi:hypothetical protein